MVLSDLKNKKIAIVGMGVNNRNLAEYLTAKKINFEVVDGWKSPDHLIGRLDNFEIIFRTPGLPYLSKAVTQAKEKGVVIYSQTKLFFDLCSCQIIGVTGTKGKGTTATLISMILETGFRLAGRDNKAYLAGNIGQDPFEFIDEIKPMDLVVLELSSFQLQDLHKSPHIAVVLKITPEHLDHHNSVEEYVQAKNPIVVHQTGKDFAVVNYDYETTRKFAALTEGTVFWNSVRQEVKPGCFVSGEKIILDANDLRAEIIETSAVKLVGRFNLENVTAGVAAAACAGVTDSKIIKKVISEFQGLPHRLELVTKIKGVIFYNDSFSTTPDTAIAALSAFEAPIVLIIGGSEKNADYSELGKAITGTKVKALIPIGITGPTIVKLARRAGFEGRIIDERLDSMEKIVATANAEADPGDIVLFSPASASFDMFADYKHRGELFKKYVKKIAIQS